MPKLKFNDNNIDLNCFKVGKVYKLEMKGLYNGQETEINVPKALITSIDLEENSIEYEPLINKEEIDSSKQEKLGYSFEIKNRETSEVLCKGEV
jgi:hypothetical protein